MSERGLTDCKGSVKDRSSLAMSKCNLPSLCFEQSILGIGKYYISCFIFSNLRFATELET